VNTRPAVVLYISNGYDVNPLEASHIEEQVKTATPQDGPRLGEGDLAQQIAALTRAAAQANVTIHTIDPRTLLSYRDPALEAVDPDIRDRYVADSRASLRVLATATGGVPVVTQSDFDRAMAEIAATSSPVSPR
jgi:hypothetical protein